MTKLNLGSGQQKKEGYINIDKFATCEPDVVWDLEKTPWPFEPDSIDEVVANHVLEHLGGTPEVFLSIMQELYRVCRADAPIHLVFPHPRSNDFAGDPTHIRALTPAMFALFSKKNNETYRKEHLANTPLALYLNVDFETTRISYNLQPFWAKRLESGEATREDIDFAIETYFNVVNNVEMTLVVRKEG